MSAAQVFKTLVLSCSNDKNTLAVAIVPVTHQVNLKSFAKALGVKKVQMAQAKQVETATGYVLGGVSPIGQKKHLKSIIDDSAHNFESIYVSGGKRGLEIEIKVTDLANVISAKLAAII